MISLRPELEKLADDGLLGHELLRVPIAIEKRTIVSLHGILRMLLWTGVALTVAGAGLWLAENVEQLGPHVMTLVIGLLAAAAYAAAMWLERRAPREGLSAAGEYLGLLGALLLSADVAWAESQFVILSNWTHHLLILAVIHAVAAYALNNRLILTVAVTALAAWFGIDHRNPFDLSGAEGGGRLLAAAGAMLLWRIVHRLNAKERFEVVLEHAAVHLAFIGSLVWIADEPMQWTGLLALLVVASLAALWTRAVDGRELHIVWIVIYTLVGIDILVVRNIRDDSLIALWLVISSIGAIVALIYMFIRRREVG